jgi:branched-chain amino acid transport system ATP-binding protein
LVESLITGAYTMVDRPAKALAENKNVKEFYLGMSSEGRKSFRDMKSYRRRKRWV